MNLVFNTLEVILANQTQQGILVRSLCAFLRGLLTWFIKSQIILHTTSSSSFSISYIRVFVNSLVPFGDNLNTLVKPVQIFGFILVRVNLVILVEGLVEKNVVVSSVGLYHVCIPVVVHYYWLRQGLFLIMTVTYHVYFLFCLLLLVFDG